jgi:hypothetical protein
MDTDGHGFDLDRLEKARQRLGVRQSSGAFRERFASKSGRGLPQSKTSRYFAPFLNPCLSVSIRG